MLLPTTNQNLPPFSVTLKALKRQREGRQGQNRFATETKGGQLQDEPVKEFSRICCNLEVNLGRKCFH